MPKTSDVDAALERFAALDEKELAQSWLFRDKPVDVRYALYRTIEDAQEACVRGAALPHPESRRILSLAQRAFGDLRGLLIGLPADLLDTAPREGEWPIREVLRHVIVIEGRYAAQTQYAVERADTDPMRVADDKLPTPAQTDVAGGIDAILRRIGDARAETGRRLGDLPAAAHGPADAVDPVRRRRPLSPSPLRGACGRAHRPVRKGARDAGLADDGRTADRAAADRADRRGRRPRRTRRGAGDREAACGAQRVGGASLTAESYACAHR